MYIRLSLITDHVVSQISSLLPKPQRLAFGAAIAEFNVIFSVVTRVKTR